MSSWLNQMAAKHVAENPESAPQAGGVTVTTMGCPLCAANKIEAPLTTRIGQFGYRCSRVSEHFFQDTDELMAMNPPKLAPPPAAPVSKLPKIGETIMQVRLPEAVVGALSERFGNTLEATLVAALRTLGLPGSFLVDGEVANQISQRAGQKIADGQKLLGVVSELRQAKDEAVAAKTAAEKNHGSPQVGPTAVVVDLDAGHKQQLVEKAGFQGIPVEKLLRDVITFALDQSWM